MRRGERGVALLEVLAAVMILAVAALTLVELLAAGTRAVTVARVREVERIDQDRLLAAYSLLLRTDLDRRIGRQEVGSYFVDVQRPARTLYRIAVGRLKVPLVEDLVTVVYRPESR